MRLIINKIILLAGIFVFVSCADLDLVDPNQPTEASYWKTENDLYAGVIAAYDALQTSDQRGRLLLMSDLGSYKGIWSRFESFQWGNLNLFENEWRQGYDLIGRGFQVIDRAGSVSGAGVPRIVAEAKFLVALGYFRLLTGFGDHIAYVDRIQNPGDVPRRAEAGELWTLTEILLTEAITDLPVSISPANYGRASKGAAQALLAKVYMQQGDNAAAEPLLKAIIDSDEYSLNADFGENFIEMNSVNPEAVFVINYLHDGPASETDNTITFLGNGFAEALGLWGDHHASNYPEQLFTSELDNNGEQDVRMNATLFWDGTDRLFYGQTHLWWLDNTEVYDDDYTTMWYKFSEQADVANNPNGEALDTDFGTDYVYIRYADILLLYAEVLNDAGNTTEAYAYVDQVRARANMHPLSSTMPGMAAEQFLTRLKHERATELCAEGVRWYDLKRWGDYGPASIPNDSDFEGFVVGQHELFSIPQVELDLNPNLIQNPGY